MRGIIQLLLHFAPLTPSARLPRPSVLHATRSARGDMWAPLGRQKLRRRHLAAVSHAAGQAARAVRRSPTSPHRARAQPCVRRSGALRAPLQCAAAAVLDDDLTLTSAAMPLRLTLAHCTSEWARIAAVTIPGIGRRYGLQIWVYRTFVGCIRAPLHLKRVLFGCFRLRAV